MENPRQLSLFDDPSFFESIDVEFKSGRGGLPGSLWETYSAFANTNGGTVYVGIAEGGEDLDVHGIKNAHKWWIIYGALSTIRAKLVTIF